MKMKILPNKFIMNMQSFYQQKLVSWKI